MCALSILQQDGSGDEDALSMAVRDSEVDRSPRPQLIKTEANLLRLPLFALHTKGLKTLDGIECKGRTTRDGQTHQFTFRATRNTATVYPGPLARSAHLAFLSIITDRGLPLQGPITWTWRDLCRRMRVIYGGQMVRHLKEAITSTAALFLQSEYALYSKPDNRLITTQHDALHLYDRVSFVGSPLPDGGVADSNYLWLSDWYRENLNAMFTAPLDYELWRHLDEQSPIASRLYEFLLLNLYSVPVLRINYRNLVQFLPIHGEKYRSSAERQFELPLRLLQDTRIIAHVDWADAKDSTGQLHLYRGDRLPAVAGKGNALPFTDEDFTGGVEVRELRNLKPPEWSLVTDFYRLWSGETQHRPNAKELQQARDLITQYGTAKAKGLLPILVKRLKVQWPDAKTFGGAVAYVPEALRDWERAEHHRQQVALEKRREQAEQEERTRQAKDRSAWKMVWDTMTAAEQDDIRRTILANQPRNLAKHPAIVDRLCVEELARRRNAVSRDATGAALPDALAAPAEGSAGKPAGGAAGNL